MLANRTSRIPEEAILRTSNADFTLAADCLALALP